jgi:hypothetical protein
VYYPNNNQGGSPMTISSDPIAFQKLAQYHACKLQLLGMRHSSGRSIIAHVKKTYGLKGNNESVVEQFKQMLIKEGILR